MISISLLILLAGCESNNNEKLESDEQIVKNSEKNFEELANKSKEILNGNEKVSKNEVIYSNSPYSEYVKVYLDKDSGIVNNDSLDIVTDIISFELIKEEKELAAAFVTERTQSIRETSNFEIESNYYYVFKKEKGRWKIYDFIPTRFVASEEKILEDYKSK